MGEGSNEVVEIDKWDVALAALIREECRQTDAALSIDDFSRLARVNAIRFDDIMETVFALCIHAQWHYVDAAGNAQAITQAEVDKLYVDRRLYEKDLRGYSGLWSPLNG